MKRFLFPLFVFLYLLSSHKVYASISIEISDLQPVNDYYSVDVKITGEASGSSYYVQALFRKADSSNYSGFTWSQKGEWIKYRGSPEKDYIKANFPLLQVNQSTKLLVKPDEEKGGGDYSLRFRRYTGGSNSPTGDPSNELSLLVQYPTEPPEISPTATNTPSNTPQPTQILTPNPTSSPTNTPTSVPTKTPISSPSPSKAISKITQALPTTESSSINQDILGESSSSASFTESPSPTVEEINPSSGSFINKALIVLGLCLALPAAGLYFYTNRIKIT